MLRLGLDDERLVVARLGVDCLGLGVALRVVRCLGAALVRDEELDERVARWEELLERGAL